MSKYQIHIWIKHGLIGLSVFSSLLGWIELFYGTAQTAMEAFCISLLFCPGLTHILEEILTAQEILHTQELDIEQEKINHPERFDKLDRFDSKHFFNPNSQI